MAVTAVHQLLPTLLPGDAVGAHTLEVARALRDLGLESEIWCQDVHPEMEGQARRVSELPARSTGAVLIYQFAIESALADVVRRRPEPLVVNYHNVTPARYFRAWDPGTAQVLALTRAQLSTLAPRADLGMGVSSFNEAELAADGYARTAVVPVLVDPGGNGCEPDRATLERLARARERGGADLLFVGRLAPHKAQHDLVKVLAAYRAAYDPSARLHLIGRPAAASYGEGLRRFVAAAGLSGAVEIVDQGLSQAALAAYYRSADVLVSCSEHEGFCVPLLEAMHHDVPVVAYAAAAVPETLGTGGILLRTKDPLTMAAAVARVSSDAHLRESLVAAGRARLSDFSLPRSRARLAGALAPLIGLPAPALRSATTPPATVP